MHPALLFVSLSYGFGYSVSQYIMPDPFPPSFFVFLRLFAGGGIFLLLHALFVREKVTARKDYIQLFLCGFFGVSLNMIFFFQGLALTSSTNASVIMVFTPALVLIFSYFWLRERVKLHKWLGVGVGFAGVLLLLSGNLRGFASLNVATLTGDFLILLNATSYAVYLILIRPLMMKYHPLTVVKWAFLIGFVCSLPVIIPAVRHAYLHIPYESITLRHWWGAFYVVVFVTVFTFLLNAAAIRHVTPTIVSYYVYIQPVCATLIDSIALNNAPGFLKILAALLILAGVFVVNYAPRPQRLGGLYDRH